VATRAKKGELSIGESMVSGGNHRERLPISEKGRQKSCKTVKTFRIWAKRYCSRRKWLHMSKRVLANYNHHNTKPGIKDESGMDPAK
jgi:hypothetical protein